MIEIGSDEHKERFCRQFVATHRRYRPATQAGAFLDGFTLRGLVEACVAEHARRMADFDSALLRRRLLPWAGGAALAGMRRAAAPLRRSGAA
jgi:hypothetical protein